MEKMMIPECALQAAELHTVEDAPGYQSWPMIAAAGKRLVCAYSSGTAHDIWEPCRNVCTRYSDDGGAHWSAPAVLTASPDRGDVPIGKGNDGSGAILFWIRCAGKTDFRHELYRSADGIDFKKIAVFTGGPNPIQITDVFFVPDTGLMALWFAGEYRKGAVHQSWGTLTSQDHGRTWTQRTIEQDLPWEEVATEPSAVYLGNGRILAVTRTERNGDGRTQFQLQSEDSGCTWKRARTNIGDISASTPSLLYDRESGLMTCYYYHRGAGLLKRRTAEVSRIWDHPQDWPEPEIVVRGSTAAEHAGNVNAVAWNGRHAAAFYSGTKEQTAVYLLALK